MGTASVVNKLPRNSCKRCGHKWIPRSDNIPIICPSCKSPYWNRDRTVSYKRAIDTDTIDDYHSKHGR